MEKNNGDRIDRAIRIVNILVVIAMASLAIWQYRYVKNRDFKVDFYNNQIKTVNEVFSVVQSIYDAKTVQEKQQDAKKFWGIWYGSGRAYLTSGMYKYLGYTANYINSCIDKIKTPKNKNLCEQSIWFSVTGFAREAREDLANAPNITLKEIGKNDAWGVNRSHD